MTPKGPIWFKDSCRCVLPPTAGRTPFRRRAAPRLPAGPVVVRVVRLAPRRSRVAGGRRREATSIQASDEPGGARRSGTLRPKTRAKVAVVGHDEEFVSGFWAGGGADVVGERQDHPVGSSTAGIANANAGRDALAADPSFRRAVEHELDRRPRRDHRPQATDQGGGRLWLVAARQGMEEVRPVDDQPRRVRQRIARPVCRRPVGHW